MDSSDEFASGETEDPMDPSFNPFYKEIDSSMKPLFKNSTNAPLKRSMDPSMEESMDPSMEQSMDPSFNPFDPSIDPLDKGIDSSMKTLFKRSKNRPLKRSIIEQSMDPAMEESMGPSMEESMDPSMEESMEASMEESVNYSEEEQRPLPRLYGDKNNTEKPSFESEDYEFKPLRIRPVQGVPREEWGAKPPSGPIKTLQIPVMAVLLTYTGSRPCTTNEECCRQVRKLQRRDMAKGYPDIRYNFLIGGDGYVYEGRGWDQRPQKKHKDYRDLYGFSIEVGMISRRGKYTSREDREKEEKMNIIVRKYVREARMRDQNRPTPGMFHSALDLVEFGEKNRYIIPDKLIINAQ